MSKTNNFQPQKVLNTLLTTVVSEGGLNEQKCLSRLGKAKIRLALLGGLPFLRQVTLNLPEGLIQFLEDFKVPSGFDSVESYLEDAVIAHVQADIDGEAFNPTVKEVAKKYDLAKEFGVSV